MDEKRYRALTRTAIVLTVAWIGWTLYDSGLMQTNPVAWELDAARKNLEDGRHADALTLYRNAYRADPENLGALRGMAQALMLLGARAEQRQLAGGDENHGAGPALSYYNQAMSHYDEAIAREEKRAATRPGQRILGVAHANRGILRDRMGDYEGALSDYDRSMGLAPDVTEGPGFLTRFMRNQAEKPPTVADRARYLRAELAKPASERLLRMPALDARQRAYSME